MNLNRHFLFSIMLIFSYININGQNKKENLDNDFGIELFKLEEKFTDVNQKIELFPYDSPWCKVNGIEKRVLIKELNKINIGELKTRENGYLTFVDDLLYKIEICMPENEQNKKNVITYFTEKYGVSENKTEKISSWETDKTYLEVKINSYCTIVTMYSKNIDNKVKLSVKLNEEEIYESYNKKKKILNERKDKGNSTFIPDVNFSMKLLQNKTSPKSFEKLLPVFRVKDSISECSSYNEKTNEVIQNKCLVSQYSFMYKDEVLVNVQVTSQNDEINRFEYYFDVPQNISKFKSQVIKNGFQYDSRLTKVYIKLGFRFCLAYTKKPGYTFVYYDEKKFTISK